MTNGKPTYEELEKRLKELENSFNRDLWLTNTRLQLALDSANIGIHEWKIDTNEFIWDSRIYEFWGLPNGTPITMELFQKGVHPDDLERVQKEIEPLFDNNSDGKYFIQYRVIGIETKIERWVEFSGQMHYENGKAKYSIGTAIDITEKKQQAQELTQAKEKVFSSEDKFRLMIANSPDAIIIQDENGAATFISPPLKAIFGHEPNDYLGKSIPIQSIYPEDLEKCKNAFNALQAGSELIDIEYRFYKQNGEIAWVQHTARPTFSNGKFTGIQNNIRDITKRKKAIEELRVSNLRYQTFFEQSHDGIIVVDPKTASFLEFNDQVCKQLGYSREEFAKLKIFDIEAQESTEQTKARIESILTNGKAEFETKQKTKQGEIIDINVIAQIIELENSKVYHCIWRDITDLKRYEKELVAAKEIAEESEVHLRTLINALPDLIWLKDVNGVYLNCNNRFEDFFGAKSEAIVGKSDFDFMSAEKADFFRLHDKAAINAGKPTLNEEEITFASDGHREYLETIKTPLFDKENQLIGVLGIGRDITFRKKQEQEIIAAKEKAEENQRKFKAIADTSPLAIYISKGTRQIVEYINPTFYKLFGYSYEEVSEVALWWPLAYPDIEYQKQVSEEWNSKAEKAIQNKSDIEPMEVVVTCKDGSKKNILWGFVSTGDENWAFGMDLTAYKNTEKELITSKEKAEESELLVKTIFQQTKVPKFLLDDKGYFIDVNQSAIDFYGYTREQFLSMNVTDINQTSSQIIKTEIQKSFIDNKYLYYRKHKKANGDFVDVEVYTSAIKLKDQKLIQSIIIDISERQTLYSELLKAKERAEENENQLKKAQKTSKVGNWIWYIPENKLWWSDEMYNIFEIDKQTFVGELDKVIELAIHPSDKKAVEQSNNSVMVHNKPIPVEYRINTKDGSIKYVLGLADNLICDENGKSKILRACLNIFNHHNNRC